MNKRRVRVGLLFGGRSCEHEVSVMSAKSVLSAINTKRYEPVPIGITRAGEWITMDSRRLEQACEVLPGEGVLVSMLPDPERSGLVPIDDRVTQMPSHRLDVVFPMIHGSTGEDGSLQGLCELADVPYVGTGVLGSALGMDKAVMKGLLQYHGLNVTPYRVIKREQWRVDPTAMHQACELAFPYPWFVKPANGGSSIGVSKVHDCTEFTDAMEYAARYDRKLIVEAAITGAREIEVAVIGNEEPKASVPGEIVSANEFYDYDAKYLNEETQLLVPAPLSAPIAERLRVYALKTFRALECSGMVRVDFLLRDRDNKMFVSEINTVPGFTEKSMFPRLWEASGIPYPELIERLIQLAMIRHAEDRQFSGIETSVQTSIA